MAWIRNENAWTSDVIPALSLRNQNITAMLTNMRAVIARNLCIFNSRLPVVIVIIQRQNLLHKICYDMEIMISTFGTSWWDGIWVMAR